MSKANKQKPMTVFDGQNNELMTIRRLEQEGHELIITGKIMGAMPMKARIKPEEARAALKLLNFKTVLFLLTLLFRPSTQKTQ
jgi:hypothetical protein